MSSTDNYTPGWFTFMRDWPLPTHYPENKTPVTVDVLETGWIVAFCVLAGSVYLVIPGQPKGALIFTRVTLALLLGLIIMLCNFGHEWEVGELEAEMPYRAGTGEEIHGNIGIRMGLRAVNITLKADAPQYGELAGETINYNERFSWTWAQGRNGFGPMAGRVQQDFRYHQRRGTPLPILWVAEYFTFDGEGLRFGRNYRLAGWYAHICIWTAFVTWFLSMVLFNMVIKYGACMLTVTGMLMTMASLIWVGRRNDFELMIPFDTDKILRTHFGYQWYLALIVGIVCMMAGIILILIDNWYHETLCAWFGINPLAYADYELETSQRGDVNDGMDISTSGDIEMSDVSAVHKLRNSIVLHVRGRGTSKRNVKTQHLQVKDKPRLPTPTITLETTQEEEPAYINIPPANPSPSANPPPPPASPDYPAPPIPSRK